MSDSIHNAVLKLLAILLGLWGLVQLIEGLDRAGALGKVSAVIWGILVVVTAIGFFRMRGWAFLLVSVGLLGSFFVTLVDLLMAIDRGEGARGKAFCFVATIALIGYLGRWSMERRFRPHLESLSHH
ncbi:MAG: hypothetical protein L6Q95_02745 [Planctomycetes bacterium]|nr:hypothetical protein [Planctomycetota bacterium]